MWDEAVSAPGGIVPDCAREDICTHQRRSAASVPARRLFDERDYTEIITGAAGAQQSLLIEERSNDPDFGELRLRVIQIAESAGVVDEYVVREGTDITNHQLTVAAISFAGVSEYFDLHQNEYEILVTPTDSKLPLIDTGAIRLDDDTTYTVALLAAPTGAAPYHALLLRDDSVRLAYSASYLSPCSQSSIPRDGQGRERRPWLDSRGKRCGFNEYGMKRSILEGEFSLEYGNVHS